MTVCVCECVQCCLLKIKLINKNNCFESCMLIFAVCLPDVDMIMSEMLFDRSLFYIMDIIVVQIKLCH